MGSSVAYTYQNGWNNGQWANKHEYDVWGFNTKAPTYNYDPMYRSTEPYYTGHPYDGSLNIYFAENRFYDAETGTWLSSDPIKDGLNWYTYCEGNPTTYIDILGLDTAVINGYVIENVYQDCNGQYVYNVNVVENLIANPNFSNNGMTTAQRAVWLDSLSKKDNGSYITGEYFSKILCGNVESWEISKTFNANFVGYLAYDATGITQNPEEGFFALYKEPTLMSESERYNFDELYKEYGVEPYGALQGFSDRNPNESGEHFYGGQRNSYVPSDGTLTYKSLERYGIALGPTLQNSNFTINNTGINAYDMAYGTCVDVLITLDGTTYYIPAIIVDVKAHSYPDGIFQTNIDFNKNLAQGDEIGNIVEWYTPQYDEQGNNKSKGLGSFNTNAALLIYINEQLH